MPQVILPVSDYQSVRQWIGANPGSLWTQIAKTAVDDRSEIISPGGGFPQPPTPPDYVEFILGAATPPGGILTDHTVWVRANRFYPTEQILKLDVIDPNSSAVLSTTQFYLAQTLTDYLYTLPTADVAGFNSSTYSAIHIRFTAVIMAAGGNYVYVSLLNMKIPGGDLFFTAEGDLSVGGSLTGGSDVMSQASGALLLGSAFAPSVDSTIYSAAEGDLSLGGALVGGLDLPAVTLSGPMAMSGGLHGYQLPQSRRDRVGTGGPLGAPVSRRDQNA